MLKNCTIALLLILMTSAGTYAQGKMAYINMQQLIASMPEAKRAYDTLQLLEESLNKDGQALMMEFQAKVEAFSAKEKMMSADMREIKTKELENAKAGLEAYKVRMEEKIAAREQQLTAPIVLKARKAVSDIAAEKGYVCVLNNSKDIIVTASCEDILVPAKQKLGIK
jgi:outer membrane protein